jgi:hypothetical protein
MDYKVITEVDGKPYNGKRVSVQLATKMADDAPGTQETHYGIKFSANGRGLLIARNVPEILVIDSIRTKRMIQLDGLEAEQAEKEVVNPEEIAAKIEDLKDELDEMERDELKDYIKENGLGVKLGRKTDELIVEEIIEKMQELGKL